MNHTSDPATGAPSADSGPSGSLELLRRGDVRRILVSYVVTYMGSAMAPIAMAFGVLELTGSPADAGIVVAAPTFAMIGVLLFGGVLADRTSRKHVVVVAELLAMTAQLAIAAAFLTETATVPILAGLMLVNGAAMSLNAPAQVGLVTQIAAPEELQALNAFLGTARNGAMTAGAALGGVLVATFGAGTTLLIDALSFGLSAILVFTLSEKSQTAPERASVWTDLRLGWREFISHTWLWVIVSQFSLLVAATEAIFGLIGPAVALGQMNGASDWGIVAAAVGAGTLVGGLASIRLRPRYPMRFAVYCALSFTALPLALSVPLPLMAVVFAAFVQGICGQIFGVIWYTTLQRRIPSIMLSRVSAYDHLGSIVLAPLGIVFAGFLFEDLGFRVTLWVAAAAISLPTLGVLAVRDVRMMTDLDASTGPNSGA